jgi:CBS domain-containing protein
MRRFQQKVETFMTTGVVTVRDLDSVEAADTLMKLGQMRHTPVVDHHGNLIGMLSARDVLASLPRERNKTRVGEFMSRHLITVTPGTSMAEAIELLLEHRFGALPVVGDSGQVVGILTETDVLHFAREALRAGAPARALQ